MSALDFDLGEGHILQYFSWCPDDLPGNRERFGVPLPRVEKAGASIVHLRPDGADTCRAAVHFDIPENRKWHPESHLWQVESWEPLTLSPSIRCMLCGDHGFIRHGRWVKA